MSLVTRMIGTLDVDDPMNSLKLDLARHASEYFKENGFSLSGGTALQLHGLTDRLSQDVDMFATHASLGLVDGVTLEDVEDIAGDFELWVQAFCLYLKAFGYDASIKESMTLHTKINARKDGYEIDCDFSVADKIHPCIEIEHIQVRDKFDTVRGKLAALFDRSLSRDFYDSAQIIESLGLSFDRCARLAHSKVSRDELAARLNDVDDLELIDAYGVTRSKIDDMRRLYEEWFAS